MFVHNSDPDDLDSLLAPYVYQLVLAMQREIERERASVFYRYTNALWRHHNHMKEQSSQSISQHEFVAFNPWRLQHGGGTRSDQSLSRFAPRSGFEMELDADPDGASAC